MIHLISLFLLMGIFAISEATDLNSSEKVECQSPFTDIGGHCVHIDFNNPGTWYEARQLCQSLGGDLVNLADAQFYADLVLHINALGTTEFYWIGATDEAEEDHWVWTDGTAVRMGTPFWANYGCDNNQMPTGGTEADCQSPFTEIGGHCLYIDYSNAGTWYEARQFCQSLGGDLVNLGDLQLYGDLLLHIDSLGTVEHYWIGATDEAEEGHWLWTDGSAVRMGTPYWTTYGCDNNQMPTGGTDQNCACLDPNYNMYFNDVGCGSTIPYPICEN